MIDMLSPSASAETGVFISSEAQGRLVQSEALQHSPIKDNLRYYSSAIPAFGTLPHCYFPCSNINIKAFPCENFPHTENDRAATTLCLFLW